MAIDRQKIIETMSSIEISINTEGLIEKFNVLLSQFPTRFWNGFAERLLQKTPLELVEPTKYLLYNAAHECGYHTGYGIITSQEWREIIAPMVEKEPEDILHGALALFTAWGWGDTEVQELVPGEKMVVRVYDYYESDVVEYGSSRRHSAYMISGVCAAFMELAYAGPYDPKGGPIGTFSCEQVKGIECGDSYGEFVVTKARG
jgi:hypothetical protein